MEIFRSQVKAWMRERRGGEEEPNSRWNLFGLTFHKSKLLLIISVRRYLRNRNLHICGAGNLYPFVEITILTHNVKPKQAMPGVHWILLKWDGVSKNNVKLAHTSFVKKKQDWKVFYCKTDKEKCDCKLMYEGDFILRIAKWIAKWRTNIAKGTTHPRVEFYLPK